MRWAFLQIVAGLALLSHQPEPGWTMMDLSFAASLLAFHLVWSGRHKFTDLQIPGSLYFSFLLGFTALMCICDGPLIALGLFWPALLIRLQNRQADQRAWLALVQFLMALSALPMSHYLYLSGALASASLVQAVDSKVARWLNTAALTLGLGALLEALLFPPNLAFPQLAGDPTKVVQCLLLLCLPQVGLRLLRAPD